MTTARCARRYVPPATDFQRLIDAIEANDELAIECAAARVVRERISLRAIVRKPMKAKSK
jgi:hypothetical protein